jgi:hypothetical protein
MEKRSCRDGGTAGRRQPFDDERDRALLGQVDAEDVAAAARARLAALATEGIARR